MRRQHLALADPLELPVKALVDGEAPEIGRPGDLRVGLLRDDLDVEGSGGALPAHVGSLLKNSVSRAWASHAHSVRPAGLHRDRDAMVAKEERTPAPAAGRRGNGR